MTTNPTPASADEWNRIDDILEDYAFKTDAEMDCGHDGSFDRKKAKQAIIDHFAQQERQTAAYHQALADVRARLPEKYIRPLNEISKSHNACLAQVTSIVDELSKAGPVRPEGK